MDLKKLADVNDDDKIDVSDILIITGVTLVGFYIWSFVFKSLKRG